MPPAPAYPPADIAAAIARALRNAGDTPQPYVDYLHSPLKYAGLSQNFLDGAWTHLDAGDLPQASNKAWGLVAETLKAVSAHHGRFIHKHRSFIEIIDQLCRLAMAAGDAPTANQISGAFIIARDLHANFYENDLTDSIVLGGLIQCEELSALLYTLFWPAGAATAAGAAAA